MARCLFVNNCIRQILVIAVLIKGTVPYEKIYLESTKLCSYHNTSTAVILGEGEASGKILVQSKYFDRWSGNYNFYCGFSVRSSGKDGIYAVIQSLNFRKDAITGQCKDYVEIESGSRYSIFGFAKSKGHSKKFCGRISPQVSSFDGSVDSSEILNLSVSHNGFVSEDGLIHVKIVLANEKLKSDEKLDINIVFTAFKHDCSRRNKTIQCRRCEWIWEKFLMDKVQNCPYASCLDEDFCKNVDIKNMTHEKVSSGIGTKVSIGAVATIISVLIIFACCVWISRRMQLWCFKSSGNRQSRLEMNRTQRSNRFEDSNSPYGDMLPENIAPSAPPISEDKDLPPSYSSLFPEK